MCAVLSEHGVPISPSTYYEWIAKTATRRQLRDAEVAELIATERGPEAASRQTLGSRKMWIRLRGQGHDVARCTVERIMREHGWEGARYGSKHPDHDRRPAAHRVTRSGRPRLQHRPRRIGCGWPTLPTCRPGPGWSTWRS